MVSSIHFFDCIFFFKAYQNASDIVNIWVNTFVQAVIRIGCRFYLRKSSIDGTSNRILSSLAFLTFTSLSIIKESNSGDINPIIGNVSAVIWRVLSSVRLISSVHWMMFSTVGDTISTLQGF